MARLRSVLVWAGLRLNAAGWSLGFRFLVLDRFAHFVAFGDLKRAHVPFDSERLAVEMQAMEDDCSGCFVFVAVDLPHRFRDKFFP